MDDNCTSFLLCFLLGHFRVVLNDLEKTSYGSEIMLTFAAMAVAVGGWSPVIMMTLIPADLHLIIEV